MFRFHLAEILKIVVLRLYNYLTVMWSKVVTSKRTLFVARLASTGHLAYCTRCYGFSSVPKIKISVSEIKRNTKTGQLYTVGIRNPEEKFSKAFAIFHRERTTTVVVIRIDADAVALRLEHRRRKPYTDAIWLWWWACVRSVLTGR